MDSSTIYYCTLSDINESQERTPTNKPFFSSYPSIEQFRNVVSDVSLHSQYIGKDASGNAMYDITILKPTITFTGTVKIHGTNSGVCFNNNVGIWCLSRNSIITVERDNAGFASFVNRNNDVFIRLLKYVASYNNVDLNSNTIALYGEWAGKKIQKGVAVANLDPFYAIFAVKIIPFEGEPVYPSCNVQNLESPEHRIFNIFKFDVFSITIDFENPSDVLKQLEEMTLQIEKECPIGKVFGSIGTGEGIVWIGSHGYHTYRFKTKGEKHSVVKQKNVATISTEKMDSVNEFIERTVTENRLLQGIERVFTMDKVPVSFDRMSIFCKWIFEDIMKEEKDTITTNGFNEKEVSKEISKKSIFWFRNYVKNGI
jgi:hypothetical protein